MYENRDEEHQQADEHERRERKHHRRVEHRALHPPPDLRRLLDVQRDPVEDLVQDSGSLPGLDHRDEQPLEDLGVPLHRLREEQATLDVGAELPDHRAEVRVLGLVLQDHQRLLVKRAGPGQVPVRTATT